MNDLVTRLRAADPCPAPVAYDDDLARRHVEQILRTDLTVREVPLGPRRRWPRPGRLVVAAVAAVAIVLAVAGVVVGVQTARPTGPATPVDAWTTFSGGGLSLDHPTAWASYPPMLPFSFSRGVVLLSSVPVPPVCSVTTDGLGTEETSCGNPDPDLSRGGVLVDWRSNGEPSWELTTQPGISTTVDGLPARIDRTDLAQTCVATGAVRSVQVAIARPAYPGNWFAMTACVGPGDVDAGLAAVDRMLASVRIVE